jgi:hypothetical protein
MMPQSRKQLVREDSLWRITQHLFTLKSEPNILGLEINQQFTGSRKKTPIIRTHRYFCVSCVSGQHFY